MAVRTGLEPATSCVTGRHSNQLNYRTKLRGEDLNLRPSGYEPDELPDCSTPRRAAQVSRLRLRSIRGSPSTRSTVRVVSRRHRGSGVEPARTRGQVRLLSSSGEESHPGDPEHTFANLGA